ncbi:MAG TPA: ABC transporter ATP-binding protein, partial [Burkholderiaceae bacterium]|nr:ABC transporter ATP-binding protein [Burkholderiaceae bacterium]
MVSGPDLYRALWRNAEGKRHLIFASGLLLIAAESIKLSVPWLAAQAINALQTRGLQGVRPAAGWAVLIFVASVVGWMLHGPGRVLERNVAMRVRERLSDTMVGRLLHLPLAWHEQHHSGESVHRLNQSTHALYDFAQSQFIYLQNVVNLVGPLLALVLISRQTGAAAIVGYGLIMLLIVRFDRTMMRLAQQENAAERRLQAAQVDSLGNIVSILALRLQAFARDELRARLVAIFGPLRRAIVLNEAKWCSVDLLNTAMWCSLVALYVWLAQRQAEEAGGALLLGGLFMVHQYTQQAGGVVTAIAAHYQSFARHRADFASAEPIVEAAVALDAGTVGQPAVAQDWRLIELTDLTFTHPRQRGERPTLDHLSLTLGRGRRIALVGESGSGKSSLLRVLAGLYDAQAGRLAIDGREAPRAATAGLATLIPQDAEVFETTLERNLTMAAAAVDPAALREVIEVAALEGLVAALPAGLATELTERGGNLSGGQRQRIALARGLVAARQASLLLLDEVTSSLDPGSEATVFDRLFAGRADACVIASIHRLHLLRRFTDVI